MALAPETEMRLSEQLQASLQTALAGLLDGAADDLEAYVADIQADMVVALATQDDRWLAELVDQAEGLAATHRLRASRVAWEVVGQVILGVLTMGAGALRAAGGAA